MKKISFREIHIPDLKTVEDWKKAFLDPNMALSQKLNLREALIRLLSKFQKEEALNARTTPELIRTLERVVSEGKNIHI